MSVVTQPRRRVSLSPETAEHLRRRESSMGRGSAKNLTTPPAAAALKPLRRRSSESPLPRRPSLSDSTGSFRDSQSSSARSSKATLRAPSLHSLATPASPDAGDCPRVRWGATSALERGGAAQPPLGKRLSFVGAEGVRLGEVGDDPQRGRPRGAVEEEGRKEGGLSAWMGGLSKMFTNLMPCECDDVPEQLKVPRSDERRGLPAWNPHAGGAFGGAIQMVSPVALAKYDSEYSAWYSLKPEHRPFSMSQPLAPRAIYASIVKQDYEAVCAILEGPEGMAAVTPDRYGRTPLHFAAHTNNLRVIQLLFNSRVREAERNQMARAQTKDGYTAARVAFERGHSDALQLLIRKQFGLSDWVIADLRTKYGLGEDTLEDVMNFQRAEEAKQIFVEEYNLPEEEYLSRMRKHNLSPMNWVDVLKFLEMLQSEKGRSQSKLQGSMTASVFRSNHGQSLRQMDLQ